MSSSLAVNLNSINPVANTLPIVQAPTQGQPVPQPQQPQAAALSWDKRAIAVLNKGDQVLNGWMPNWTLQTKIDELGRYIENKFSCFSTWNNWVRSDCQGSWSTQLATYLVKLPLRAAHNIINLLYNVIKSILYTAVHPLEGMNNLAKLIIRLVHALTQPETYCKMGTGMIGAGLGTALVLNAPVSLVGMLIGSALATAGLSVGALKAAITAEEGRKGTATMGFLRDQLIQFPESALTGFYTGVLIGAIRRATCSEQESRRMAQLKHHHATNLEEAQAYADQFVKQHNLPPGYSVRFESGNIIIKWPTSQLDNLPIPPDPHHSILTKAEFIIPAKGEGYVLVDWYDPWVPDDNHCISQYSFKELGL